MAFFTIAPLDKIKGANSLPEYVDSMKALEAQIISRATARFTGQTPGGIIPGSRQWGLGPLRKNDMAGDTTDNVTSGSYRFINTVTTTGWADLFNYNVRDSNIHGFVGFKFADDVQRIIQLRLEIGDKRMPLMDLQTAVDWNSIAVIFKTDVGGELVGDPGTRILVRGYWETTGTVRVIPLGLNAFSRPDIYVVET